MPLTRTRRNYRQPRSLRPKFQFRRGKPTWGSMIRATLPSTWRRQFRSSSLPSGSNNKLFRGNWNFTPQQRRQFAAQKFRNNARQSRLTAGGGSRAAGQISSSSRTYVLSNKILKRPPGIGLKTMLAENVWKNGLPLTDNTQTVFELDFLFGDMFGTTKAGLIQIMNFLAHNSNSASPPAAKFNYNLKSHNAKIRMVNTTTEDATWKCYVLRCVDSLTVGQNATSILTTWNQYLADMFTAQSGFTQLTATVVGQQPPLKARAISQTWRQVGKFSFSLSAGSQKFINIFHHINKTLCAEDLQYRYDTAFTGNLQCIKGLSFKLLFVGQSMPMAVTGALSSVGRPAPGFAMDVLQTVVGFHDDQNFTQKALVTSGTAIPSAGPYTMINDVTDTPMTYTTA